VNLLTLGSVDLKVDIKEKHLIWIATMKEAVSFA
jgi:hypothetical protein